jgi:hypothetical protein
MHINSNLLVFNGSGKWPDDAALFEKTRAGFGVHMAQLLREKYGLRAEASEACVDVFYEGFAFRLYLHSERYDPLFISLPTPLRVYLQSEWYNTLLIAPG